MSKILKVIKKFYLLEVGDTLELSEDGTEYTNVHNEELNESDEKGSDISARFTSTYSISTDYAKLLIEEGYLAPYDEPETQKGFVNVFDEIDTMLETYNEELDNLDEDFADEPACLKVEKETVLRNMIKVLNHLNSLKK
jgi:hypothetical protein